MDENGFWMMSSEAHVGQQKFRGTEPLGPKILVVDYGIGNLRSVANALGFLGCDVSVSDEASELDSADALVLPGVGAFGEGMQNLRHRGLVEPIRMSVVNHQKPLLGICLGMQMLAEYSEERGSHEGLGLISGQVRQIPTAPGIRLPHVGWNSLEVIRTEPLFGGIQISPTFYFVHGFHLVCDEAIVSARCHYGSPLTAAIQMDHIFATQFHPERSQSAGLQLLRNFASYVAHRVHGGVPAC